MQKKIKWRFVLYIIIPYIFVFFLPSFLYFLLLQQNVRDMYANVERSNTMAVESIVERVDSLIGDLGLEMINLSLQTDRMASRNINENLTGLVQLHIQLSHKCMLSPILNTGYIIMFGDNTVVTPYASGVGLSNFYATYFSYKDLSLDEFTEEFTQRYYNTELLGSTEINRVGHTEHDYLMAHSIPSNSFLPIKGVILFELDLKPVSDMMASSLPDNSGALLFHISDGEIEVYNQAVTGDFDLQPLIDWAHSDGLMPLLDEGTSGQKARTLNLNGQELLIYAQSGSSSGIYCVLAQHRDTAFLTVQSHVIIVTAQAIFVFAIAVLIMLRYARYNVHSIQSIIDTFPNDEPFDQSAKNPYALIQLAASRTISENVRLSSRVELQHQIMREDFFRRLLNGDLLRESDVIQEQEALGISPGYQSYIVVLIVFPHGQEGSGIKADAARKSKEAVYARLRERLGSHVFFVDCGQRSLAAIICSDFEAQEAMREVEAALSRLEIEPAPLLCASRPVRSLYDMPMAYTEARQVFINTRNTYGTIVWYQDIYVNQQIYSYQHGLYVEQKLVNQLLTGNAYEAVRLIAELKPDASAMSRKELQLRAHEVYRVFIQVFASISSMEEARVELNKAFDIFWEDDSHFAELWSCFERLSQQICLERRSSLQKKSSALIDKVTAHIEGNFTDPQLSINLIAQQFDVSAKYLSQFFKEQRYENISSYIERLRIEESQKLLTDTDMTIEQIASNVGYTSSHTYRAAFKRILSISPSEYRDSEAIQDHTRGDEPDNGEAEK